jgi:hypothetical protein
LRLASRQLFIRSRNETLSVVAMRVSNPNRSPVTIHGCNTTQLQPDLLRSSAIISQFSFTRPDCVFLLSTQQ